VKADLHQALAWQERSAKNDDPEAEAAMGRILTRLYKENAQVAREWYQLSAEQDYTRGMLGMASTFFRPGSPPDQIDLGRQWLELAAKDGNGGAAFLLAGLYLLNPTYAAQPDAAAKAHGLLKLAAKSGDVCICGCRFTSGFLPPTNGSSGNPLSGPLRNQVRRPINDG